MEGIVDIAARAAEAVAVAIIVVTLVGATARYLWLGFVKRQSSAYSVYREQLGRGLLIGLEVLVAADIIRTVAITPTLDGVLVLGVIVLIRTFLSMALQVELEGRWPWQSRADGRDRDSRQDDSLR